MRTKVSWLLVRFDFEGHELNGSSTVKSTTTKTTAAIDAITSKDIYNSLRESISLLHGPVGFGQTTSLEVRLYDKVARIAMIRTPIACSDMVRTSLTFLTSVKSIPVVASILSVNRSLRTAKIAALGQLCKLQKYSERNKKRIDSSSDENLSCPTQHFLDRIAQVRDL